MNGQLLSYIHANSVAILCTWLIVYVILHTNLRFMFLKFRPVPTNRLEWKPSQECLTYLLVEFIALIFGCIWVLVDVKADILMFTLIGWNENLHKNAYHIFWWNSLHLYSDVFEFLWMLRRIFSSSVACHGMYRNEHWITYQSFHAL